MLTLVTAAWNWDQTKITDGNVLYGCASYPTRGTIRTTPHGVCSGKRSILWTTRVSIHDTGGIANGSRPGLKVSSRSSTKPELAFSTTPN